MHASMYLVLTLLAGCRPPPESTAETGTVPVTEETATETHTSGTESDTGGGTTKTSGCGNLGMVSGFGTFDHGGVSRLYALLIPAAYDPNTPTPVVFAFHGWGGSEQEYVISDVVRNESDQRGYIVIVPRGLGSGPPDESFNSWSFRGSTTGLDGDGINPKIPGDDVDICADDETADYRYDSCKGVAENGCSWTQCQDDDVDFVLDLLDTLETELCIDPDRVFATGGSNGGMFTWELAQNERSAQRIRAIAPLIGLPHRGYLESKGGPDDLPVLSITGTEDRTVPPGEWDDPSFTTTSDGDRYHYTGATAISQSFAEGHGCDASGAAVPFDVRLLEVDCRTHCASDSGWPRVLDCRGEMGHTYQFSWSWPLILDFYDQWQ